MSAPQEIPPAVAVLRAFGDRLTPAEKLVLPYLAGFSERHDQRVPRRGRYVGTVCGRGFGKSWMTAREIVRLVLDGSIKTLGLVGPVEETVIKQQVAALIEASPPWCKPEFRKNKLIWPNGAEAFVFSAEAPEIRGYNFEAAWLTELVAWSSATRRKCFDNISTCVRVGIARIFWDTTSKGQNDVILYLRGLNRENPEEYPIIRGTIFDNPVFSPGYLKDQLALYPSGRRRNEELYGRIYKESAGALWQQSWIDDHRRSAPAKFVRKIVGIDPAMTNGRDADEVGLVIGCEDERGDVYLLKDRSAKMTPDEWCKLVIDECDAGACGVFYETNRGGLYIETTLRAHARDRGYELVAWPIANDRPMPPRQPGKIYAREIRTQDSKDTRATGAAAQAQLGRVHHVGELTDLEHEMTNWVPGDSRSPNRLDAAVYVVLELSGLIREKPARAAADNVLGAVAAAKQLTERLRSRRTGRRVGL